MPDVQGAAPSDARSTSHESLAGPLPAAFSSFLGRGEEVSELLELLGSQRLVTLTGAPGIGKSRLALEVAGGDADAGREGTTLLELAPVGDPELVPRALAGVLRIQEAAGMSLTEVLVGEVRRRRLLLVVDNCEHVIGACAELLDALLRGCPDLRVLATSREPLAIVGERVYEVPPLSVPGRGQEPQLEALIDYDAVRLFVDRARGALPAFELNEDVAGAVAEITRRLDGIPLAIELAAARIRTLTASEIAHRLDDRFALLTQGSRSDLPRHQTLQAAIDWSHELLSGAERAVLRRLAVFASGFSLEAAEEVCSGGEVEPSEVLDLLGSLISKSLVVSDTLNSRGRYRLLETIRAYAADRLEEAGEQSELSRAHARFYLALAERAEPELVGPGQVHWFDRLDAEHEDLRVAIRWSLGHGLEEWALRLTGALVVFWRVRCYFSTGRELLEDALAMSDEATTDERAKALWGAGFCALMAGDPDAAQARLLESLSSFRELGDPRGAGRALMLLGNVSWDQATLQESVTLAREAGDHWCLAHALGCLGNALRMVSDYSAARPFYEEAITVAREAQDKQGLRYGLLALAAATMEQGGYESAARLYDEALSTVRALREEYNEAVALSDLAVLACRRGDYGRARELFEEALVLLPEAAPKGSAMRLLIGLSGVARAEGDGEAARRILEEGSSRMPEGSAELQLAVACLLDDQGKAEAHQLFEECLDTFRSRGQRYLAAMALQGLAGCCRRTGDLKRAAALHDEALGLRRAAGVVPEIVASLEAIGGLSVDLGCYERAARLLGAGNGLRERNGYLRLPWEAAAYEADLERVRAELSDDELSRFFGEGMALSADEACVLAINGRRRHAGKPTSGWDSLTAAERPVAMLVAEGLTNPQIATQLMVSLSTVKTHVRHVYAKLGVASRRELEREVRRRGEAGP